MFLISQAVVLLLGLTIVVLSVWGMFVPDKLMSLVKTTMELFCAPATAEISL